ncbi:MAG: hypothetical protein JWN95_2359 [Frankiales bacterium]|nr:hypothetical protein [Frankiales bacterium]
MTTNPNADENWQVPSLAALRAVQLEQLPAFEVLLIDDLAGYVMGAGPLAEPYTVENGSRVVSALFGAMINATKYLPAQAPVPTEAMTSLRESFVQGAHAFAELGVVGLGKLVNRLVTAAVGELELHKDDPGEQTQSLFYYTLLAVASGPLNLLAVQAASGAEEIFLAWDRIFGEGMVLPWRQPST